MDENKRSDTDTMWKLNLSVTAEEEDKSSRTGDVTKWLFVAWAFLLYLNMFWSMLGNIRFNPSKAESLMVINNELISRSGHFHGFCGNFENGIK